MKCPECELRMELKPKKYKNRTVLKHTCPECGVADERHLVITD
jgi:uncharacterized protein YlaI